MPDVLYSPFSPWLLIRGEERALLALTLQNGVTKLHCRRLTVGLAGGPTPPIAERCLKGTIDLEGKQWVKERRHLL